MGGKARARTNECGYSVRTIDIHNIKYNGPAPEKAHARIWETPFPQGLPSGPIAHLLGSGKFDLLARFVCDSLELPPCEKVSHAVVATEVAAIQIKCIQVRGKEYRERKGIIYVKSK